MPAGGDLAGRVRVIQTVPRPDRSAVDDQRVVGQVDGLVVGEVEGAGGEGLVRAAQDVDVTAVGYGVDSVGDGGEGVDAVDGGYAGGGVGDGVAVGQSRRGDVIDLGPLI